MTRQPLPGDAVRVVVILVTHGFAQMSVEQGHVGLEYTLWLLPQISNPPVDITHAIAIRQIGTPGIVVGMAKLRV